MSATRVRVSELVKELIGDGKVVRSPRPDSIKSKLDRGRLQKAGSNRRKEGLVEAKAFQKQFVSTARRARWEKAIDQLMAAMQNPLLP